MHCRVHGHFWKFFLPSNDVLPNLVIRNNVTFLVLVYYGIIGDDFKQGGK